MNISRLVWSAIHFTSTDAFLKNGASAYMQSAILITY